MQPIQISKNISVEDFRRDLRVLEREIGRQLEGETGCCGVTLAQCHVLLELSFSDLSLTGLVTALDLDASTLSRTVEALVRAGLVERTTNRRDRRSVRLTLTPEGRNTVARINVLCNRSYLAMLEDLNSKDRNMVAWAVRLLADRMRRFRATSVGEHFCCETVGSLNLSRRETRLALQRARASKSGRG